MARPVEDSTVIVRRDARRVGGGFLVARDKVLTCAHVVNEALGRDPHSQHRPGQNDVIQLDFPLLPGNPMRRARVDGWFPPPRQGEPTVGRSDTASLRLLEPAPRRAPRAGIRDPRRDTNVVVYGLPTTPEGDTGAYAPATLRGSLANELLQVDSAPGGAVRIQPGFSGFPVVDRGRNAVVGMIVAASRNDDRRDCRAIPAAWLRKVAPAEPRWHRLRQSWLEWRHERGDRTGGRLLPAAPARTRADEPRRWSPRRRAWSVAGAAVVSALLAGYLFGQLSDTVDDALAMAPENCVDLQVSVSTEKDELLAEFAKKYNASGRVFDGWCARIDTAGLTSGTAMNALAEGWPARDVEGAPEPQVWLPTSSMWPDLLRHAGHGNLLADAEPRSITSSVLALAMQKRMVDAMREFYGEISWEQIAELAQDPQGWGAVGHREWGRFILGRDNPHRSTSGLAASVATYYAASGKDTDLTEEDLHDGDVAAFVHGIESSVRRPDNEATKLMKELYDQDLSKDTTNPDKPFVSAMLVQEQLVYLYNNGAPTGELADFEAKREPHEPMVAVQPAEDMVRLDHPFVVLATATDAQRAAARDFAAFLLDDAQQARFRELGFRELDNPSQPTDELVEWAHVDPGQSQTFYPQPEAELVKAIQDAWDGTRRKARVLLVLDVSRSMGEDAEREDAATDSKLERLIPAVKRGLKFLGDSDQVGIWTFDNKRSVRLPMSTVGDVRDQLAGIVDGLSVSAQEGTALYETTLAAHEEMLKTPDSERNDAIVLLTDGWNHPPDSAGRTALLDAVNAKTLETSVPIFTIPYGPDADADLLREIAERSVGGNYDASNLTDIDSVMVSVFSTFG